LPACITFVHGSPFQFVEDQTKYACVFHRYFAQIRNNDPVYQEVIPLTPSSMTLRQRISLEIDSLIKYLALRNSQYAVTISEKNRHEVELLYGHQNVVAASAGGFSKADFTYQRKQNMKMVFGLENKRVILSLCRLVPKKRVDLSIQAFAKFIGTGKGDDCILVVAGTGPHEEALKSLVHEIQIEEKVKFIGYVPEHQLRDWYGSCDVFLNADNADYDLSLMMALALGCKVVVSSQYDFPKKLDKTLRFAFISPPSVQGFARGIGNALDADPPPLNAEDFKEFNTLAWDEYFETILSLAKTAIINRQGMN
jgi:glycosyltransferase involved in cell wall biosynthesis